MGKHSNEKAFKKPQGDQPQLPPGFALGWGVMTVHDFQAVVNACQRATDMGLQVVDILTAPSAVDPRPNAMDYGVLVFGPMPKPPVQPSVQQEQK